MRLRDRERDFGQRREEATIGGGGCGEPALSIWFRPKSEKVRVWVWGKSGKREVDAQSPWLPLAAAMFRSTNSDRGSGKVLCLPLCNHTTAGGGAYRRCLHHWWPLVPFFFSLLSFLFLFAF